MKKAGFKAFLFMLVLLSSIALAHEGEPAEQHSPLEKIAESPTLWGSIVVLLTIAAAGYVIIKKRKSPKKNAQSVHISERIMTWFIVLIIVAAVFALGFTAKSMFFSPRSAVTGQTAGIQTSSHFGAGGFTDYDLALAKRLMDKDGDGICDTCGMSIDFCIQNGQLQCTMGGQTGALQIGVLDTTKQKHHYHADFKVFINGEEIDFNKQEYFVKSRFMHVENDVQGDSGKVLHMHATGVPLWLFFESLGMEFTRDCLVDGKDQRHCNDAKNSLKFYVNGEPNDEFGDYVFADDDRLLISYGKRDEDISSRMASVTAFAPNH